MIPLVNPPLAYPLAPYNRTKNRTNMNILPVLLASTFWLAGSAVAQDNVIPDDVWRQIEVGRLFRDTYTERVPYAIEASRDGWAATEGAPRDDQWRWRRSCGCRGQFGNGGLVALAAIRRASPRSR